MSDEEHSQDLPNIDRGDMDSAEFEEMNEAVLRDIYENSSDEVPDYHEEAQEAYLAKKVVLVNRPYVAALLENDRKCRKERSFPLVSFEEIKALADTVRFEVCPDLLCDRDTTSLLPEFDSLDESELIERLEEFFPQIHNILAFGEGHLVAAGGAITTLFNHWGANPKDCDFFFHGLSIEEAESITQKVIKWWLAKNEGENNEHVVYRNAHCTTLFSAIGDGPRRADDQNVYQLVHRCYQSPDEVIGGFDLAPCALLYDGQHIWATELGAFSIVSHLMIVDVSRRSKSFSERITKYVAKGFKPVFLTKSRKEIEEMFPLKGKQTHRVVNIGERVRAIVNQCGTFVSKGTHKGFCPDRSD